MIAHAILMIHDMHSLRIVPEFEGHVIVCMFLGIFGASSRDKE